VSTWSEHVLPQMIAINTMRDHLAHYASQVYAYDPAISDDPYAPIKRYVSNAARVSRYGNERIDTVSFHMLMDMKFDLYAITHHLNAHHEQPSGAFRPWREGDPNDPPTPWLYKPPQPVNERRKSPSAPRKRESPRKSSSRKS
jgi:hypothetical protein